MKIFNWLKPSLKKDEKFYTVTKAILDDKTIICYYDLYTKMGIIKDIEKMVQQNEFGKYHYKNIQANYNTVRKLDEFIRINLCKSKNRFSRMYNEKHLSNMAAMDSLQWAPKMNNDLKDDEILVILPNNKNFVEVTKDML